MRSNWPAAELRILGLLLALLASCLAAPAAARGAADCTSLKSVDLPHVEIVKAEPVTGSFTEDVSVGRPSRTYTGLPTFCRVYGFSRPVTGSRIGFEVWMPVAGWSGRIHMVGGGAYVSNISYEQMIPRLREGDVAVGTDTGHTGTDLKFGWHHRERIVDFAYRAVHESIVAAKAITRAYYGEPARQSYFSGCSTGGYQGLSEAQRYPEDFDGIIAGAPGSNRTNLTLAFLWNFLANHRPGDDAHAILSRQDLLLINRAVIARCDKLDGVADGVISYPPACRFDLASLRCKRRAAAGSCLDAEQIAAARKIYQGPRDARTGRQIFPPLPLGSEGILSGPQDTTPGWSGYWSEGANPAEPSRADLMRYWVFDDPRWNWWHFDWGKDVDTVDRRLAAIFNATDANLDPFKSAGGKLIMFIGWEDPVGSAWDTIDYYEAVTALAPGASPAERLAATQAFARLYLIPGMGHCAGGPGASHVSTATRDSTPPVLDAEHDMTRALERWVEDRVPPQALIATHYADASGERAPGQRPIAFQRPLCVYPLRPVYRGGPASLASSFACAPPG